jgi:divalent metal cation (Fe/Co/Zn/Cd) transporter
MSQLPSRAVASQARLGESASTGIRASLKSVIISLALSAVKVISGVVGHSYALIADGAESILDVVSGVIVAGSLKIAAQPPDEKYPFGYGKVEPVAALVISTALLATAIGIAIQSVREIHMPRHAPAPFTLIVLIVVVVIKELLFRFLVGGEGYEPADDWAALFAAGVIAFNGIWLLQKAWREMLDASLPEQVIDDIREIARRVDGVSGIDMCRVRKSGLGLWVDIHVEVPGDMTVRDGHHIAHRVKDALLSSGHRIMDVLVHIEPADEPKKKQAVANS